MVAHTHEVLDALEQLISTLKDAETGQRGYLITGEPRYLDPYELRRRHHPRADRAAASG